MGLRDASEAEYTRYISSTRLAPEVWVVHQQKGDAKEVPLLIYDLTQIRPPGLGFAGQSPLKCTLRLAHLSWVKPDSDYSLSVVA